MNKEPKETDESNESDSEDESDGEEMSVENRIRVTIAVESGADEPAGIRSDASGNTKAAAEVRSHQQPPKSKILDL
eukprot:scaffold174984_cov36-Cyclotella_meneghiniana.AAC.1